MKSGGMGRFVARLLAAAMMFGGGVVAANPAPWQLNLTKGVTPTSHEVWNLHMLGFYACVAIGVVVFGAMFVAIIRFRHSKGAVAETWSHNTKLEVVWTVIPVLILVGLAWPATNVLLNEVDTSNSALTVKVTGFQWKWRYDYVDYQGKSVDRVGFMSSLALNSNKTRQLDSGLSPWDIKDEKGYHDYLLNVDHKLVLPTHTKIRFAITGGDVIHSWWVPDLGWKVDAIPGVINEAWATIEKPGIYRGQCAELCGQDHAFMPIVVKAVSPAEFNQWLAAQKDDAHLDQAARTAQAQVPATPPRG